jgi:hypothetical protein
VSPGGDERKSVTDPDARTADRRRARQIHAYSLAAAVAGTAVIFAVGVVAV